jgi:hypothetical protein
MNAAADSVTIDQCHHRSVSSSISVIIEQTCGLKPGSFPTAPSG